MIYRLDQKESLPPIPSLPPKKEKPKERLIGILSTAFSKFKEFLYYSEGNEIAKERRKLARFWSGDEPTLYGFDRPNEIRPGKKDETFLAVAKILGEEFQRERMVLKLALDDVESTLHKDHVLWFFDIYRRDQFVTPMNQLYLAINDKRWEDADAIYKKLVSKISNGAFPQFMESRVKKVAGSEAVQRALKSYHMEFWRSALEKMPYLGERT